MYTFHITKPNKIENFLERITKKILGNNNKNSKCIKSMEDAESYSSLSFNDH